MIYEATYSMADGTAHTKTICAPTFDEACKQAEAMTPHGECYLGCFREGETGAPDLYTAEQVTGSIMRGAPHKKLRDVCSQEHARGVGCYDEGSGDD